MYALFTQHDEAYAPLSSLTWDQNKMIYAKRHGYATHVLTDKFVNGFQKIHMAKNILENNPNYKWIWWTGADSLITNMKIKIEDRVMDQYHFLISVDNNGLNADSLLIRNSPEGRAIIDDILSKEAECSQYWDSEQKALGYTLGVPLTHTWTTFGPITIGEKWRGKAKIVPQKYFNSYDYKFYGDLMPDHRDRLGVIGHWSYGDWLIHWPAITLYSRIDLANFYSQYIIS